MKPFSVIKLVIMLICCLVTQNALATDESPNCGGANNWPAKMAFVRLKNAGLTDNTKVDFSKTKVLRVASQIIGNDLYRQVHEIIFMDKSGFTIDTITVSNSSNQECSEGDVDVIIVSKHLR